MAVRQDRATPAIRITIYLDESRGRSRVISQARMTKRLVASSPPRERGAVSGFWIELRNSSDQVVYESVMDDPTRHEGPPPRDSERYAEPPAPSAGILSFIVPEVPGAVRLVIMASRPADAPALPIADFQIAGAA